jgi:uncharacterized membrane protein
LKGLVYGSISGLIYSAIGGLWVGILGKIKTVEMLKWSWREAAKSFRRGLIVALIISLFAGVLLGMIYGLTLGLVTGLFYMIVGMLVGVLACGGLSCFRHFILRFLLYRLNYTPWNYARFLDNAANHLFMQKVGGSYIFVHRMLMEHFAKMELEQGQH